MSKFRRKTPDELLKELQPYDGAAKGHLKIFLGYASGVGKSFRMLDEARRRKERGQDVIVGAIQPTVPPEVNMLLDQLETIPPKAYPDGPAMDIGAIIRRRPEVCVIDGLAYDNPPGCRNLTRWQDSLDLVGAGIKVMGSINIQYVDELHRQVEDITGKQVHGTVPVSFLKSADEIEIVDAPAAEPMERTAEQQTKMEVRQQQLSALREMALVLAADVVDSQLNHYLESHGIRHSFATHERILVCITPRANARDMIETARRVAEKFHAEMTVAYVKQKEISADDLAALEEKLDLARASNARVEILDGDDAVGAILKYAYSHSITQLYIGHTQNAGKWPRQDPVEKLIRKSDGMDLRIFPSEQRRS